MAFNRGIAVQTPLIGVNIDDFCTPASEAVAPFNLGSCVTGENGKLYQFVRLTGTVANEASIAVDDGVQSGAATATNSWTNSTGKDLSAGDYAWLDAAGPAAS